jgi:hypothetical protein
MNINALVAMTILGIIEELDSGLDLLEIERRILQITSEPWHKDFMDAMSNKLKCEPSASSFIRVLSS